MSRSIEAAVSWLFDTSKTASLGRGTEARVISAANRPTRAVERALPEEESKGAEKGREVSALWETLRFESAGRENRWEGRDVMALCDRSRVVRAARSANWSGRETILFI
jgi:hypothetical protein